MVLPSQLLLLLLLWGLLAKTASKGRRCIRLLLWLPKRSGIPASSARNGSTKPANAGCTVPLLLPLLPEEPCSSSFLQLPQLLVHSCSQPGSSPPHLAVQQVGSRSARAALLQGWVRV
jgi:hypothetical protein